MKKRRGCRVWGVGVRDVGLWGVAGVGALLFELSQRRSGSHMEDMQSTWKGGETEYVKS